MADKSEIEQLLIEIKQLRSDNEALWARIRQLEIQNRQLHQQLEEAQRQAARQAGPFRREEKKKIPPAQQKPPGRKPGHPGSYRIAPDHIDQTVELPLAQCPKCGGAVEHVERIEQIIEEIPPVRPHVVRVITYQGECACCGLVESHHPLQTSHAQGAAKVQLGPRALALGACLNKVHGLTMRKTCQVLQDLCGLRLTAGGLSQALSRISHKVQWVYEDLTATIRGSPVAFADETSWWVGGPKWWLWVFTNHEVVLYHVDRHRGSDVVDKILGPAFAGMLVSDCLSSYDPAICTKHKCIAHHLRAISKAEKLPGNSDTRYLSDCKTFFRGVIALYGLRNVLDESAFCEKRHLMEDWCDELLGQCVSQPGDISVKNRLSKQRPHLLGCLYEPLAEPTNNRAERALRPAVIARKVSCGNKTEKGRECWQILTSIGATCRQRAIDFIDFLAPKLTLAETVSG